MGAILRVRDKDGNVYDIPAIRGAQGPQGPAGPALAVTNTAAVGQTIKVSAVDENGQPTEWEAVDMASGGGGSARTQKLIDITFTEPTASLTVTLEHNFHKLFLVWSCGADGAARLVDADGNALTADIGILLDTTSYAWNDRKIGQIHTDTKTWLTSSHLIEYTEDLSTLLSSRVTDIKIATVGDIKNQFGGEPSMIGTLGGSDALAPTVGRTVNIVTKVGFFAATTRIILVGEYYE